MRQREAGAQREACELFEASVAAGPSPHGWLQVGLCREPVDAVGALEAFEAARRLAASVEDPMRRNAYLGAANERIEPLAGRVPTVTFRASPTPGAVAEVTLVGRVVASPVDRYDEALRFNVGRYQVRAWAPGFFAYTLELQLTDGERRVVTLPALHSSPVGAVPPDASPARAMPAPGSEPGASTAFTPRSVEALVVDDASGPVFDTLPLLFSGGGLLLVLSGVVAGQLSSNERRQLERECDARDATTGRRRCGIALAGTRERMADLALAADVLWVGGALLAATGVALFVVDQQHHDRGDARVVAGCGLSHCSLSALGRF